MSVAREELHSLIDALPDNEVIVARRFLEFLIEAEERLENIELEEEFGHRVNTPLQEWIEQPEGVSTLDTYRKRQQGDARG